jgi:regulator of sirC expression with transglutaminase-like and TPR domain
LKLATRRQVVVRMLLNLKRLYVRMRSFPHARLATHLLVALSPSSITELRDRGLLAYHVNDLAAALRDLEEYLRLASRGEEEDEDVRKEHEQVWAHVKVLRRRLASFN